MPIWQNNTKEMVPLQNGDGEPIDSQEIEMVAGFEALHESSKKCFHGVMWKDTPASYFLNNIEENLKLEKQIKSGTYKQRKPIRFRITYPKSRDAVSIAFRDRVFQRSLNDSIIYPRITKSFIYDNMACQSGKGPDRARSRLTCFLQRYYRQHGKTGYILKCDLKGYYQNMSHKVVTKCFSKVLSGWTYREATAILAAQHEGSVGFNPGSQIIQIAGISILSPIDHFIKESLHIKYYIRYMDDFILIHEDKEYLEKCKERIIAKLQEIDCTFNSKKTSIGKISEGVDFLGFHMRLTDTGKVIKTLNSENIKHERKKLKKLVTLAKSGKRSKAKVDECYSAWKNHAAKGNSYKLIQRMDIYYKKLWEGM